MKKIICGLTASGKTNYAIKIAKENNSPIINIDSRQIYKFLDIGTNKGKVNPIRNIDFNLSDEEIEKLSSVDGKSFAENIIDKFPVYEIEGVEIYLHSFLNPDQKINIFAYKNLALALENKLIKDTREIIYVGGTGLYIDAIVKDYEQDSNKNNDTNLKSLENANLTELYEFAKSNNIKIILNKSDSKNPRRVFSFIKRSIEGSSIKMNISNQQNYEMIYIDYDWGNIKLKIENRVQEMISEGIIDETKNVLTQGYAESSIALQGIGYREVLEYLNENINLDQLQKLITASHVKYAKRQRTWFEGEGRGYNLKVVNSN